MTASSSSNPAEGALAGLRAELQELLDIEWDQQLEIVERLCPIYHHSIRGVHHRLLQNRIREFNCFGYAFHLYMLKAFFELTRNRVFVFDHTLVNAMVAELIEKPRHEAVDGDLVIYSTEAAIVHAGLVRGQGVCSKWGTSHIWEHGTFEIPAEYGGSVRYFASPPAQVTCERFLFHAKRQIDADAARVEQTIHEES